MNYIRNYEDFALHVKKDVLQTRVMECPKRDFSLEYA
jgi:hypothetical protein